MERKDVMTISLHMDHGSWGPSHTQSLHVSTGWQMGGQIQGDWRIVASLGLHSDMGSMGSMGSMGAEIEPTEGLEIVNRRYAPQMCGQWETSS